MYEVEYVDGHKASLSANAIAENLFAQVDDEGNRFVLLDAIADHRVNGKQLTQGENIIKTKSGGKRYKQSTKRLGESSTNNQQKGWENLLQWKDGSTTWEALKDVKNAYPVQLAMHIRSRSQRNRHLFGGCHMY